MTCASSSSLLRPGETCWRVEQAGRVAFLIDAQAYYAALLEALEGARQSVWILGWAFDPRTRLTPDGREGPDDPDEIAQILLRLTAANPDLDVRVLIWKSPLSINGSHAFLQHRARKAFRGTRVRYREAGATPFGACHHQKVVIIDGELAFCGGGDIAVNRWDSMSHLARDPRRILPHLVRHAPRHDVMILLDGPAAAALGDLFRERWLLAGGGPLPPDRSGATLPSRQAPHLQETRVALARTLPALRGRPLVDEILRLRLASIAAARDVIYLENQYFTSHLAAAALARRLAEPDGPEVVLVLTGRSPSWFDRLTMDPARAPLLRRLAAADVHGRFRAYAPRTGDGEPIIVHSKVAVIDDRVASVGSANLNNRSEGFDTECEVTLEGADAASRRQVRRLREILLAHWLDVPEAAFAEAGPGVIARIEALNHSGRLTPLSAGGEGWWGRLAAARRLGDPAGPDECWRLYKPSRRAPALPAAAACHALAKEPRHV